MPLTTRRQAKGAAAAHDTDDEGDRHLNVPIPDDIDEDMLANILPDLNLAALSVNDVLTMYRQLISQAVNLDSAERDRDEFRAELERKDVELDQALQDKESISKELETSAEAVHEELKKVKHERDQLAETNNVLQAKLTDLENLKSSSSHESDALRRKVEDTEREKRDLVVVISRLKDESTQRDEEVHTLRASLKEARQEHQALEGQVRELRSAETTTTFKIDSLSQHLTLAQGEAERAVADLTAKTEEFTKYRRAKHTEIATLQASFDSLSQTHSAMEASYKALQSSHTSQSHQLTQSMTKVQEMSVLLAEQEARYSSEANNLRRLISLMEDRESQAKSVVDAFERDSETIKKTAERREAALIDEAEREKKAREAAEQRLEQLERVLERVGRGEFPTPGGPSAPSTPFRTPGTPGFLNDGMMGLSPTVAMASRTQRSGKTFTEVYADYVQLQEEYAKKCGEYDNMDRTLSSVLAQIEERAPILSQQRAEYERLQAEAQHLESQLSQAIQEREDQAKLAKDHSHKLAESTKENTMLQRQLDDLGRQIQNLLREIARRDDPTIPTDEEMENLTVEPVSDTQTMITNNLVLYKSIDGLQNQNQRLLKIVRELGDKMEAEEREYREAMALEQEEAIKEAHEAMQDLVSQLDKQKLHYEGLIQGYVKERDSFRVMLARAEKGLPVQANGSGDAPMQITSGEDSDLAMELAEVQQQFENYKTETTFDSGRTREDLVNAQREVSRLGTALAKSEAQVEFLQERHRMHEEKFRVHSTNLEELNKRNRVLQDQNVRLEIECNRLADELEVHITRVEQLRNENANLRAEKKIWESVQGRLVEENRSLSMERSHLSDLMNNVQKMHSDLERSGENDRRRLENQLQMLESQTKDLRDQIVQERDAVRHISLQKELESKDLQARLDKSASELSKTRETLIEAQTSRKHLEEKVDDLTRQMQGNVEKLSVYERRPSTAVNAMAVDQEGSREQQLEAEVAELRSALKMAEVDLAAAKTHRDQYQEISQSNETALASLNATFDEYKVSTEAQIARHESELKALQERLEQANSELSTLRTQHSEAQKIFEADRTAWVNDRKTLEDTIVDLSTSEKHSESSRSSHEQELKLLEEQAKAAEERYSREIIAHAESMKSLDALKKDLSAAQAASRQHMSAAETAQAKLVASESSWTQQKQVLDQELDDLKARCKDLAEQNTILHQHLESVTAQAARIREAAADAPDQSMDGETADSTDTRLSELRSVVNYLRKEKGIVDLQLELSKRDNEILKSQVERITATLQETRSALTEERERAIQNTQSAAQHAELVERINQLNILRESNATLRAESESASKKARELENKLVALAQELDPAKEKARNAQAEINAREEQVKRLETQVKMWQERNNELLTKYDRQSMQELKEDADKLKVETIRLKKENDQLQEDIGKLKGIHTRNKEIFAKNKTANEAKSKDYEEQISRLQATVETLRTEITALQAAQATVSEAPPAPAPSEDSQALIASLRSERDALLQEKETWSKATAPAAAEPTASTQSLEKLNAEKSDLRKQLDEATQKIKSFQAQVQALNKQHAELVERSTAVLKKEKEEAQKHKAALAEALEKLEKANANAVPPTDADAVDLKRHLAELRELEEKLKAQHEIELKTHVDAAVQQACKDLPAPASDGMFTPEQHQAAIDAAVAAYQENASKDIEAALERGRKEAEIKGTLKANQLTRAQARVKELEMQIKDWVTQGLVTQPVKQPATPTAKAPSAPASSNTSASTTTPASAAPKPQPSNAAATAPPKPTPASAKAPTVATAPPTTGTQPRPNPAIAAAAAAATNAPLPRRPAAAGTAPARGAPPLRGRGGALRGAALRQMPQKSAAQASNTPAAAPATEGVSIIGAANKRPHDDAPTGENSLAKRLKPNGAP